MIDDFTGLITASWCAVHQRDYARDTSLDGEMLGCCSLCAAALAFTLEEVEGGGELHEHFTSSEDDDACDDGAVACAVCTCLIGDEVAYGDTWDGRWVCEGCAGVEVH